MLRIKRVYEPPASADGVRVLVDRLWPRGLTRGKARVDEWLKDIAPTDELRKSFAHDPERWPAFKKDYVASLRARGSVARAAVDALVMLAQSNEVTVVYAAKDTERNNAVVVAHEVERRLAATRSPKR